MTLASRFLARLLELPPADTYDVTVERDLEIPMPDGFKLLADRYSPRQGGKLRLQVSSGAHPRFARNPGTGEPLGTAKALAAADQAVFHDPAHPSALLLPAMDG